MSLHKIFGGDKTLETSGIEVKYGTNERTGGEITITIARSGGSNTKFLKTMESVMKPYRRQLQHNLVDPDVFTGLLAEVFAKSVVLSWANVDDSDGNELACTPDNVQKMLIELPELFADLQEVAGNAAAFRREALDNDAKNS